MNYEIHVGDYVKTIGGFVGWISNIKGNNYIVITDENNNICGYYLPQDERYFVRIGAYDFTKKEKKKIEMIDGVDIGDPEDRCFIIDKINELVDAVNKLMDKEDKNDKTTM